MAANSFTVPIISKMKLDNILVHVSQTIEFLKNTEDYSTKQVGKAFQFLFSLHEYDKDRSVEKTATELGLGELLVKVSEALEEHSQSPRKTQGAANLAMMENVFWNFTDACPELGCDLGKRGAITYIVKILEQLAGQRESSLTNARLNRLIGVLNNSIHHKECAINRSIYRKAGAVEILKKYLKSTEMVIKVKSLLILAYIVDERESEILGKEDEAIFFLVDMLKKGVAAKNHCALVRGAGTISSFSIVEILDGLNHLSVNDANKKIVLNKGGITVINRMLTSDSTEEELGLAAKSLWNLSFEETVKESEAIKESSKALKRFTNSEDKSLRTFSKNALWEIADESSLERKPTQSEEDGQGHVMISYNWTHQERALKIRDDLKKDGYKVWIDVDKMEDDILESMADGVMKSEVVLLCMSHQYYASQSCRSEATYAYKKKKHLIPLLLEDDYKPEGWLDILIGTKLYYKFCSDTDIQTKMPELKKAIGSRCRGSSIADDVDGPVKAVHVETTTAAAPPRQSIASSWSTERVQKWFEEIKLPQLKLSLDFCDGGILEDMYKKYYRDYDAFEKECKSSFGLEYRDTLRLTKALKGLFK